MKYEYHLKFWGQIENDRWVERDLGIYGNDFWFDTKQDRDDFKKKIVKVSENHKVIVAFDENEGFDVRKKTIVKMIMVLPDGREKYFEYDFGYAYPHDAAYYMFHDGNYSCDCNRSIFLAEKYDDVEKVDCGDAIRIKDFGFVEPDYCL